MLNTSVYSQWQTLDALALKVLQLALSATDREEFCNRIAVDYMQDAGIMGLLRRTYFETGSIETVGQLYWGSRREPTSPRLETIIGGLLMDLAANGLFEVLKELATNPDHVRDFAAHSGIDLAQLSMLGIDAKSSWQSLTALWQLHRWRKEQRTNEATASIAVVLDGGQLVVRIEARTQEEVDKLKANLESIVRGIVAREVERDGTVVLPANGRRYQGVTSSPGLGRGRVVNWPKVGSPWPDGEFVLLVPAIADSASDELPLLIMRAAAVVISGSQTGHAAVSARSFGKPAVIVAPNVLRDLKAYDDLIVDGTAGVLLGRFTNR